ncbi:MAG: hypothetical protein ACRCVV_10440 [Shewanella sp.]
MSNQLMIHMVFKEDITDKRVEFLTTALEQSANIRIYDYNKRTLKVMVLNKSKVNSEIFAQLAAIIGCNVLNNNVVGDDRSNNAYLFVDQADLSVDTSATAKAVQKLF